MNAKNVRIKDIAQLSGVSVGTVDRVLHNRGRVSEEALKKVLKVLDQIEYKPNVIARTLGSNKTYRIGALIPDPEQDPYWACPECGLTRPQTTWGADNDSDVLLTPEGQRIKLRLNLPGDANRSNAAIAAATAAGYGLHPERTVERLREITSVAGRYTSVVTMGVEVRLLLAKNPAGWLESFAVLDPPNIPVILSVNAQIPDGKDTSWLWDVDYTVLRDRRVFVMGERRTDLALRLETDGVRFEVADRVDEVLAKLRAEQPGLTKVDLIANYTAFQQIRTAYGRVQ
jgi:UDP-N-acetylmuramyl tripeptide synthase